MRRKKSYDIKNAIVGKLEKTKKPLSGSLNGYVPPLHGIDALQIAAPKHNVRNAQAVPMLRCKYIDKYL